MKPAQKKTSQSGFSFVEVLAAFVILSFAMAAILPVYANSFRTAEAVEKRTLARLNLQSLTSSLGASQPLAAGEYEGAFDNGMTWSLVITPRRTTRDVALFHVDASVSWRRRGVTDTLRVETMRVGPADPPSAGDAANE